MKWRWGKIVLLLTGKMAQVDSEMVEGTVKLTKTAEIPLFSTIQVHGMTEVKGHDKES